MCQSRDRGNKVFHYVQLAVKNRISVGESVTIRTRWYWIHIYMY